MAHWNGNTIQRVSLRWHDTKQNILWGIPEFNSIYGIVYISYTFRFGFLARFGQMGITRPSD